jgi:hypothetical protein
MIENYFTLVGQLFKLYHLQVRVEGQSLLQLTDGDETINIVDLPKDTVLISIVCRGNVHSIIIDTTTFGVDFPLDAIDDSLQARFHTLISGKFDSKCFNSIKNHTKSSTAKPYPSATLSQSSMSKSNNRPNDMPDFDDEYEIKPSTKPPVSSIPSIGDRDLNPPGLPKNPELKLFIDPLAENNPDGGMYPTMNNPIFGIGSSGTTSRLGVPPGARFDDPFSQENLDDLGRGLPGNLRRPGPGGGPGGNGSGGGFPGFGPGGTNDFSGFGSGGPGFGGF